jgi:uncharacterized oligopeptide transporter (OPT) family protein
MRVCSDVTGFLYSLNEAISGFLLFGASKLIESISFILVLMLTVTWTPPSSRCGLTLILVNRFCLMVSSVPCSALTASDNVSDLKADFGQFAKASVGFRTPAQKVDARALLISKCFKNSLRLISAVISFPA